MVVTSKPLVILSDFTLKKKRNSDKLFEIIKKNLDSFLVLFGRKKYPDSCFLYNKCLSFFFCTF